MDFSYVIAQALDRAKDAIVDSEILEALGTYLLYESVVVAGLAALLGIKREPKPRPVAAPAVDVDADDEVWGDDSDSVILSNEWGW